MTHTGGSHVYRGRRGFTLLELLVVMALMGIVTSLGTTMFFRMTSYWNDLKNLTELDAMAGDAFSSMHQDFADTLSARLSGVALQGISREAENDPNYVDRDLEDDEIVLPIQTSGVGQRSLTGGRVRYLVERDPSASTYTLVRFAGGLSDGGPPVGGRIPVIERANVIRLRFEYQPAGSSEWRPDWRDTTLPGAVRVSMTLSMPERSHLQVSRKAVFPIHVR